MTTTIRHFRTFAHEHDSIPAFHAAYLVLVLLAASLFNLGVFGLLIVAHMTLDIVKYRDVHEFSWPQTFEAMLHENLIDITLFSIALVFSVYFHHSVGLIGISGLFRAEMTIMWAIGTIAPKFAILEGMLKIMSHIQHYLSEIHPQVNKGWRRTDYFYMSCIALSALFLAAAPIITGADSSVIRMVVLWELVPWNV